MNALTKLIALNIAILKIDLEFFDDIFTNTIGTLELQESIISQRNTQNTTTANNNIIQQISEKLLLSSHIMEKIKSSFGEKNTSAKILEQDSLASKLQVSTHLDTSSQLSNTVSDNLISISQLSNLEHTTPELHTPTSINSSDFLTRNFKEKSVSNSKNSSTHSTNIYIDKVEVNDVSNVNDLALQLQQKVSTL